jgi:cell wall-associated NlpC family hydrolase
MGRKIPSSQMRRGDVIFYGPGGSQHVALYLGDGQMLEAPYTGSTVKISPVRTSGMTPYVIRYIEY